MVHHLRFVLNQIVKTTHQKYDLYSKIQCKNVLTEVRRVFFDSQHKPLKIKNKSLKKPFTKKSNPLLRLGNTSNT